jgi:hypothetical protein
MMMQPGQQQMMMQPGQQPMMMQPGQQAMMMQPGQQPMMMQPGQQQMMMQPGQQPMMMQPGQQQPQTVIIQQAANPAFAYPPGIGMIGGMACFVDQNSNFQCEIDGCDKQASYRCHWQACCKQGCRKTCCNDHGREVVTHSSKRGPRISVVCETCEPEYKKGQKNACYCMGLFGIFSIAIVICITILPTSN